MMWSWAFLGVVALIALLASWLEDWMDADPGRDLRAQWQQRREEKRKG